MNHSISNLETVNRCCEGASPLNISPVFEIKHDILVWKQHEFLPTSPHYHYHSLDFCLGRCPSKVIPIPTILCWQLSNLSRPSQRSNVVQGQERTESTEVLVRTKPPLSTPTHSFLASPISRYDVQRLPHTCSPCTTKNRKLNVLSFEPLCHSISQHRIPVMIGRSELTTIPCRNLLRTTTSPCIHPYTRDVWPASGRF